MLNIIGNFLGTSGYDIHTRSLANALNKLTEVKLSSLVPAGAERLLTDDELEMLKRPQDKDEINLIITSPVYWKLHLNAKRNWVFLVWEGDKIPKSFLNECMDERIEYIFVASEHTKKALLNTEKEQNDRIIKDATSTTIKEGDFKGHTLPYVTFSIKNKIKVIPHGVDLEKFYPNNSQQVGSETVSHGEGSKALHKVPNQTETSSAGTFIFLCNKGFRHLEDRGGIQYAVKAYLEEFNDEDVELILKINPAYGIPNMNVLLEPLKPDKEKLPVIKIIADNIPYDNLVNLYNQSDVFVMPTRAEAYGIPLIEAMACGKPCITTNFGGQTDFCNNKNSWIVDGELTEVVWELQYEGIKWLTPNLDKLKKSMREAYTSNKLCISKGQEAIKTAKQQTWLNSAEKIKQLMEE